MKVFIGTFGISSPLGKKFVKIEAVSYSEAVHRMHETYGRSWAFVYADADDAGTNRFKLTEVPFGTPNETERIPCK